MKKKILKKMMTQEQEELPTKAYDPDSLFRQNKSEKNNSVELETFEDTLEKADFKRKKEDKFSELKKFLAKK